MFYVLYSSLVCRIRGTVHPKLIYASKLLRGMTFPVINLLQSSSLYSFKALIALFEPIFMLSSMLSTHDVDIVDWV